MKTQFWLTELARECGADVYPNEIDFTLPQLAAFAARIAQAAPEDADREDAQRYRYIKSLKSTWFPKGYNGHPVGWFEVEINADTEDMDAAVDAARQAPKVQT